MRRLLIVSVLLLAGIVSPAGAAVAHPSVAGHGAAAPKLQADFNNDGAEDLAIGAPGESVGAVESAGAINVLYGTVGGGLTGAGSQLFTQDTPGVGSTAEQFDFFGEALASGDFNDDGFTDLAVGAPGEAAGAVEQAGAVNVLFGSTGGLTGAGSQLFTQDTPGVGSTAEQFDTFGRGLAGGDFDADDADDLAVGAPGEAVGAVPGAGAINVLYGSTSRLSGTGSQLFTQNTPGAGSSAEAFDAFGETLAIGDFTTAVARTWRSGHRSRPWAPFRTPARSTSCMADR